MVIIIRRVIHPPGISIPSLNNCGRKLNRAYFGLLFSWLSVIGNTRNSLGTTSRPVVLGFGAKIEVFCLFSRKFSVESRNPLFQKQRGFIAEEKRTHNSTLAFLYLHKTNRLHRYTIFFEFRFSDVEWFNATCRVLILCTFSRTINNFYNK